MEERFSAFFSTVNTQHNTIVLIHSHTNARSAFYVDFVTHALSVQCVEMDGYPSYVHVNSPKFNLGKSVECLLNNDLATD